MKSLSLFSTLALLLTGNVVAQQTLIVDPDNGPFFEVQPAVDAANPGDTVLVRPGVYTGASIGKGLRLVFDPGLIAFALNDLRIERVPAGESVVVTGMRPENFFTGVYIHDNDGRVHIEDSIAPIGLSIHRSSQVVLTDMEIAGSTTSSMAGSGALAIVDSTVVISDCSIDAGFSLGPNAGIHAFNSDVFVSNTNITGSDFSFSQLPAPAIRLTGGRATVTGPVTLTAGENPSGAPAIEMILTPDLTLDPHVTLVPTNGAAPISGGTATITDVPHLTADYTGSLLTLEMFSNQGWIGAIFVAFPSQSLPYGPTDWWLGSNSFTATPGLFFANGKIGNAQNVPPYPPGFDLVFQGVALDITAQLLLSTPRFMTLD